MEQKSGGLYRHIKMSKEAAGGIIAVLSAAIIILVILSVL